ncbi:MAG: DUF87 domain-containing protein [Bryobacteraceae bacterium]
MPTQDFEKLGAFYLGRENGATLLYDSKDLVTHAVCVGMTGSGKTGLCIGILEEAAIDGIPAIVIDPKGDLSNLLLQFPDLKPEDFQPWINTDDAKRQNLTPEQFAAQQATLWREGLAKWGQDGERIRKLQAAADFAIYTPGSGAGLSLSILKSFAPPAAAVADDRELMRDRISVTATAVLSLLGIDADPMKSREHILLSTLFDTAWKQGDSLDLATLIHQIQSPPVTRIGVMDLETFFPAKDRFELSMSLNNLLASPGFEAWLEGDALDIDRLLHTPEGKPRISVISIAHLSDAERMFFVSLLLNETLAWTRTQSGTTSLRAILYMDEIFGYFPPVSNPPSKKPLLTLLKQARAFGVGIVLATQNPVDLDYKGLANCGTWFIGRLQTERDKNRLMDGLEGAATDTGGHLDRQQIEQMLAGLGKRMFLMNSVHESTPAVFESRWALSYLRGPLTRAQIKTLMDGRKTAGPAAAAPIAQVKPSAPRVALPPGIPQAFVPLRSTAMEIVYHPVILGAAQIRFVDPKSNTDFQREAVFITDIQDDSLPVQWEHAEEIDVDPSDLEKEPAPGADFAALPPAGAIAKNYATWNKDLVTWIYANQQLNSYKCESLNVVSNPHESERDFRVRLGQQGREARDQAVEALRKKYAPKVAMLQERLRRAQQAVEREQQQASSQTMSSVISIGASLLGAFMGRKVISKTTISSAASAVKSIGRARKESQDVGRVEETVEAVQQQMAAVDADFKAETDALVSKIDPMTEPLTTLALKPKKTNISIRLFTLAWAPYADGKPAY